ncbi:hypothetical protein CVT25_010668 [Psilocybe cyanescens]|uniref:Uncharacterized protein n=1 Tax=Psilocybe cyanescens TaxID=93625 RepID=A0A409XTA2_PSICY|nr:hypothetical protein CVT25_010668 [Psilocybe cyanescens]
MPDARTIREHAKKQAAIEAAHSEKQKEHESKNKSRDSSDSNSKESVNSEGEEVEWPNKWHQMDGPVLVSCQA